MLVQAALWSVSFLLPTLPAQSDLSGRISGRIVDALGEGVPAAEVRLLAGDKVRARTRADGEGMYVFGHISWAAAARGLLPLELRAVSPGKLEASAPVHVDLTQDHFVADLRLFDAARLTVRVVNDAGAKVAGARVHVARSSYSNESPKSPILMERSDAGGRAVFERAPVGHLTVFAHAEGHILGCRKMWLTKSTETTMSLKRGRGAVFELRIPGVPDDATTQIKLVLPKRPGVGAGLDFGVMRGPRHVIAGIPNEPAAFVLWRRGVGRTRLPLRMALGDGPAARALLVPAARTEDPVVATFKPWPGALRQLEAPRNVVRGVVLDPEGKPLAGIHVVELFGNEVAVTDADGAFACKTPATRAFLRLSGTDLTFYTPGQPLGMNAPSVIAKDSARVYHGVALVDARSKTVHRLRTMRGASLRGRVLDRDGHPLPGRIVTLEGTGRVVLVHRNRLSTSAQAVTDREGYFRFRGLAPNGSRVYATVASADRGASREVELTPGLVAHNLKVVAPPLATIGGTVLSRGGVPASGALVRLYTVDPTSGRATGPPIGHIFCTAAGEFGWPRLAPGSYRVDVLFELVPVVHSEAFRVSEGGSKALRLQPR